MNTEKKINILGLSLKMKLNETVPTRTNKILPAVVGIMVPAFTE